MDDADLKKTDFNSEIIAAILERKWLKAKVSCCLANNLANWLPLEYHSKICADI